MFEVFHKGKMSSIFHNSLKPPPEEKKQIGFKLFESMFASETNLNM